MNLIPISIQGGTFSSAVTTVAGGVSGSNPLFPVSNAVLITNAGPNLLHFVLGTGALTATTANTPINPGTALLVAISPIVTSYSVICGTGTATVYLTPVFA